MRAKVAALRSLQDAGVFEAVSGKFQEAIARTETTPSQDDPIQGNSDVLTGQWHKQYEGVVSVLAIASWNFPETASNSPASWSERSAETFALMTDLRRV